MPEYSPHQKKIIDRYYEQRDTIMLNKLGELVTDLMLADSDKKRNQLWERVRKALVNLKVPPRLAEHILTTKDAEVLAQNLRDWLRQAGK